jgi:hypothetical protein
VGLGVVLADDSTVVIGVLPAFMVAGARVELVDVRGPPVAYPYESVNAWMWLGWLCKQRPQEAVGSAR